MRHSWSIWIPGNCIRWVHQLLTHRNCSQLRRCATIWIRRSDDPVYPHGAVELRQFPLPEDTSPQDLLEHSRICDKNGPTDGTPPLSLLFGEGAAAVSDALPTPSTCAHFHGTEVGQTDSVLPGRIQFSPAFELRIDQAVDFVLSIGQSVDRHAGGGVSGLLGPMRSRRRFGQIERRSSTFSGPPRLARTMRQRAGHATFREGGWTVWNPAVAFAAADPRQAACRAACRCRATPCWQSPCTLPKVRIERMETGTLDMIRRCVDAGLPEPEFTRY